MEPIVIFIGYGGFCFLGGFIAASLVWYRRARCVEVITGKLEGR